MAKPVKTTPAEPGTPPAVIIGALNGLPPEPSTLAASFPTADELTEDQLAQMLADKRNTRIQREDAALAAITAQADADLEAADKTGENLAEVSDILEREITAMFGSRRDALAAEQADLDAEYERIDAYRTEESAKIRPPVAAVAPTVKVKADYSRCTPDDLVKVDEAFKYFQEETANGNSVTAAEVGRLKGLSAKAQGNFADKVTVWNKQHKA